MPTSHSSGGAMVRDETTLVEKTHPELGGERSQCGDGDRLCLHFRNEMSKDFEALWIGVWLDDKPVFSSSRNLLMPERVVFSGALPPGEQTMKIKLQMSGQNSLSGYRFEAPSAHSFDVTAATGPAPDRVIVIAYENPVPSTPPEERARLRFVDETAAALDRAKPIPTIKIWVSKTGAIELNGQAADLDAVDKAIDDLAARRGTALYAVDSDEGEMHQNGVRIIAMLARKHLRVRLSTKRDFTDVVDAARP